MFLERFGNWEGVIAEPPDERWVGRHGRLRAVLFEVEDGEGAHPEGPTDLLLREIEHESALSKMLAERLWLEVGFLWFQCLKRNPGEWQKSNASLQERQRE